MAAKPLIDDRDLIQITQRALEDWHEENDEPSLRKNIHTRLNKARDEILMKLLGFEKSSWDQRWQLDHCNGRAGNSIAGDYLKTVQQEAVESWLAGITLPELTKADINNLQKSYRVEYSRSLQSRITEHAHSAAKEAADKVFKELVTVPDIDKYLQTMNLLLPATE